jgi:hypothetical protein
MEATRHLPGIRRLLWVRNAALRTGILTGIYASCIFVGWLLAANHIHRLEPFAGVRNLIAGAVILFLLSIPVLRFRHEPAKMFLSGLTAWTTLTFTYLAAELHYTLLQSRMGALHIFILGAFSYGLIAVLQWVFLLCVRARRQHVAQTRQASSSAGRSRTR